MANYNEFYEQFQDDSPKVVAYFNKAWHPIKDEWVFGMHKSDCRNFMNFTDNLLESLDRKLNQVLDCHSSQEDFWQLFCHFECTQKGT